jgi:hypothetical protein
MGRVNVGQSSAGFTTALASPDAAAANAGLPHRLTR